MATGRGFFSQLFIDFVIVGVVIFIVTPRCLLIRHKNSEGCTMSFLGSTFNGNSSELLKRWRGKRVLVLNSIGFVAYLQTVWLQRPAEAETDKYSAQDRRHIAGEIGLDRSLLTVAPRSPPSRHAPGAAAAAPNQISTVCRNVHPPNAHPFAARSLDKLLS
uniref:Uncharacterized protein n=1 Tax=Anopheles quadriannulatus TaxID=34691 RepID=A0A182WSE6_ANOQN